MDKETIKELNGIREYLEIAKDDFKTLLLLAFKYRQENSDYIYDELLYEIIIEALNNMDYHDELTQSKTIQEAFNRALANLGYQKVKKMS